MPYKDPESQRAANRRYYERNKEIYFEKNSRKKRRLRDLIAEAKSVPCMDCGVEYPSFVMDFDHRDPSEKRDDVARLVHQGSLSKLLEEIAKCDVVCSNCHRIRTHSGIV